MEKLADIGVFGGSGFYSFLEDIKEVKVDTPYGMPSDSLFIGKIGNHKVAFMPRHGRNHSILPHMINFRANVWAMKHVGCTRVISPCAAGSLQKHVEPGHFVICDQFVDWTDGRKSTFFEGPTCYHPSPAETYCPELRALAIKTAKDLGITVHENGTVVVINGPRFSTKAEYINQIIREKFLPLKNVGEVRSIGLINAIELVKDKNTKEPLDSKNRTGYQIYKKALEKGVILRPLGDVIYFNPPLIIEKEDMDFVTDIALDCTKDILS